MALRCVVVFQKLAKDVQVSVIARGKRLEFLRQTGIRITCSEAEHNHTLSPQKCQAFGAEDLYQ